MACGGDYAQTLLSYAPLAWWPLADGDARGGVADCSPSAWSGGSFGPPEVPQLNTTGTPFVATRRAMHFTCPGQQRVTLPPEPFLAALTAGPDDPCGPACRNFTLEVWSSPLDGYFECAARATNASAGCPFDVEAQTVVVGWDTWHMPAVDMPLFDLVVGEGRSGYMWRLVVGFHEDAWFSPSRNLTNPFDHPRAWVYTRSNTSDAGSWSRVDRHAHAHSAASSHPSVPWRDCHR